ncbi:unnamed protein product [Rhizophagus irregularis]|nr:unnamed protein product [Rhizophagus irregularis]
MENNNSEMSDCSSNSEGSSFTEKEATLKKITELKKKIMELENTSIKKGKTKKKLNQGLVDKESIAITNKTKGSSNRSHLKDKSKSQPTLSEEDDTEFYSDEPKQPIFKKKNINYQKIPSFLHIPKSIWRGYVFHKKNPSFPETVGDWAEREMIRRHVNYRRSIINNTSNVCETQETNKSARTFIEEGYNDKESQHSEIEKHSKRKSKTRKILNDASSAAKHHKLQSDNDYEDVETSGQECEAIENDNNVSSAEKCPTSKSQSDNDGETVIEISDQESEAKEAIKNTTSTTKRPGHKFKANQPNEEVIKVPDQESEAKKAIKNTTSTTKRPGRRPKAKQPNNHDDGVSGQESEAKEVVNNTTLTTKRPGRRPKAKQPNNHDDGVSGQESEAKEVVNNTTLTTKRPGRRPKAKQSNNHDDGVSGQESEVKEVVNNTTSTTKRPGLRPKAKQSNNDNVEAIATTGQKRKAKESIKDSPLATRRPARKCKAV